MNDNPIKTYSIHELREMKGRTDWKRLALNSDADIAEDRDFEMDWSKARLVIPEQKQMISLRLDPDVLSFFKGEGRGYQTRINAILRAYMEARQQAKRG